MTFDIRFVAAAMAVAVQINATLPVGAVGLRLSLADILLAVLAPYGLAAALRQRWAMPAWSSPYAPAWLLAITAALTISLFTGYRSAGEWLPWALFNKYAGWFVLCGYFLTGAFLATLGGQAAIWRCLTVFCMFAAWTAALSLVAYPVLFQADTLDYLVTATRLTAWLQNPNSFGLAIVIALCIGLPSRVFKTWHVAVLIAALILTFSRGAWISGVAAFGTLLLLNRQSLQPLKIALPIVIGAVLLMMGVNHSITVMFDSPAMPILSERLSIEASAVTQRVDTMELALRLFLEAPLFGVGLGVFHEAAKAAGLPAGGATIHNSLLWLLTETGLAGASVFAGFYIGCLRRFYTSRAQPHHTAMLAVLAAFMAMSMTGEYLYQRYLWLLLGLSLVHSNKDASA